MSLADSKIYQVGFKYLAGWGGCVVIIGALFKILHTPGGSIVLTFGMTIEAFIFFFSVFDKDHKNYEWELVYPELLENEGQLEGAQSKEKLSKKTGSVNIQPQVSILNENFEINVDQNVVKKFNESLENAAKSADKFKSFEEISLANEKMLHNINNANNNIERFSDTSSQTADTLGIYSDKVSDTLGNVDKINQGLSKVTKITDGFDKVGDLATEAEICIKSVNKATSSFDKFSESVTTASGSVDVYSETVRKGVENTQKVASRIDSFAENVVNHSEKLEKSLDQIAKDLEESYKHVVKNVNEGENNYSNNITKLNERIIALNEQYVKNADSVRTSINNTTELDRIVNELTDVYKDKIKKVQVLTENIEKLDKKVKELDSVYGNMLSVVAE